jgi:hypothetical protein
VLAIDDMQINAAVSGLSSHVRAVGLVGTPRCCEDGPVLLGLPWPDTDVQKLVLDRRLVNHVGHPGVPWRGLGVFQCEFSGAKHTIQARSAICASVVSYRSHLVLLLNTYGSYSASL